MPESTPWTVRGSSALPLYGQTDLPSIKPRACVVLLHGYMGYKDYGFIPVLGRHLASRGVIVHRFNFAFSGMTNSIESFERPDLFAQQTWNAQVFDTLCVLDAIASGALQGQGLPVAILGHSRGGVAALLTAGRHHQRRDINTVITMSAPERCCSMDGQTQQLWLATGAMDVRSNRTGQQMTILSRWLEDQIADPEGHDVLTQARAIPVPVLAIHGQDDPTVSPACAQKISSACPRGDQVLIPNANHVYNMPNPPDWGSEPSNEFVQAAEAVESAISRMTDKQFES